VVSFILSVVICLFLILAAWPPVTQLLDKLEWTWISNLAAALSVMTHFEAFQRGVIDFRDLMFFLSLIGFALFTTGVIIRSHRAG